MRSYDTPPDLSPAQIASADVWTSGKGLKSKFSTQVKIFDLGPVPLDLDIY